MLQHPKTKTVDNCVLPTLWFQFGKESHMGIMDGCPHTYDHVVYYCYYIYLLCKHTMSVNTFAVFGAVCTASIILMRKIHIKASSHL